MVVWVLEMARRTKKCFGAGSVIFAAGDSPYYFYIIESGCVQISHRVFGRDFIVHTASDGEIFGEMSVISGTPHTNDAVAIEDTTCWLIPQEILNQHVVNSSKIVRAILEKIISEVRRSNTWRASENFFANLDVETCNWKSLLQNIQRLRSSALHEHELRVAIVVGQLCEQLGMTADETRAFKAGAQLHDIGMVTVPDVTIEGVQLPYGVEGEDFANHCTNGAGLLGFLNGETARVARDICLCHHENMDGSGFPNGLKEDDIPWSARLVRVADAFDKLVSSGSGGYEDRYSSAYSTLTGSDGAINANHFDGRVLEALSEISGPLGRIYHVPWQSMDCRSDSDFHLPEIFQNRS